MYTSTNVQTSQPVKAWRNESDPGYVWIGVLGCSVSSLSFSEAQALLTELQRELAAVEAAARSAAA
jgi:hypothetical protein